MTYVGILFLYPPGLEPESQTPWHPAEYFTPRPAGLTLPASGIPQLLCCGSSCPRHTSHRAFDLRLFLRSKAERAKVDRPWLSERRPARWPKATRLIPLACIAIVQVETQASAERLVKRFDDEPDACPLSCRDRGFRGASGRRRSVRRIEPFGDAPQADS